MVLPGSGRKRWFLAGLFLLALIGCGPSPSARFAGETASERATDDGSSPRGGALAERVAVEVRKLRPGTKIVITGPLDLKVYGPNELEVHLDNLEARCKTDEKTCDAYVAHFARAILGAQSGELTEQSLFPVVKNQVSVEELERQMNQMQNPTKPLSYPLVDDLRIVLVQDAEFTTRFLGESDIAEKGWTREHALERALQNLKGLSTGFSVKELSPGLHSLAFDNGYDASMFALHPLWVVLRKQVQGDLIVAPIARDIVLFTGTNNEQGMKALLMVLAVEKKEPAAPYPITTNLYRWEEAGWRRFVPSLE